MRDVDKSQNGIDCGASIARGKILLSFWTTIFGYAAGISSILSLVAFMASLFVWLQSRQRQTSVVETIKGEGIVDAERVVDILKQFRSDEARLQALEKVLGYDRARAEGVLEKVKPNGDAGKLSLVNQAHISRQLSKTGIFLLILALIPVGGLGIFNGDAHIFAKKVYPQWQPTPAVQETPLKGLCQCLHTTKEDEKDAITIRNRCPGAVRLMALSDTLVGLNSPRYVPQPGRAFAYVELQKNEAAVFSDARNIKGILLYSCPGQQVDTQDKTSAEGSNQPRSRWDL